jgi:hypothetical protein
MSDYDDDYSSELPDFKKRKVHLVMPYITKILTVESGSALLKLISHDDGHFRAVFKSTYFTLQEGETEPTKSQWSTLKKKMKRHDGFVFVFKQHGEIDCRQVGKNVGTAANYKCLYVDFGFFAQ